MRDSAKDLEKRGEREEESWCGLVILVVLGGDLFIKLLLYFVKLSIDFRV
jgi:hypothetical protein